MLRDHRPWRKGWSDWNQLPWNLPWKNLGFSLLVGSKSLMIIHIVCKTSKTIIKNKDMESTIFKGSLNTKNIYKIWHAIFFQCLCLDPLCEVIYNNFLKYPKTTRLVEFTSNLSTHSCDLRICWTYDSTHNEGVNCVFKKNGRFKNV